MNTCRCGCGRSCRGEYARGHHPRSHAGPPAGAPSQAMVLEAIRKGSRSREQIARDLHVPARYLGAILTRLQKRGLVKRAGAIGQWEPAL